ncbi:hypothetical protein HAX54_014221 [Datura stramonium]|uniref:Uncharacterized protein n=1 Tax=Datura stramonium TaxID=4076 RepID=A0ABS8RZC7_DATST|nr:hypothetical protein [Datura stramonium]
MSPLLSVSQAYAMIVNVKEQRAITSSSSGLLGAAPSGASYNSSVYEPVPLLKKKRFTLGGGPTAYNVMGENSVNANHNYGTVDQDTKKGTED